jgi:hydroxymethylpyrimidine pyrophosphatase-like HAD family hydrolase
MSQPDFRPIVFTDIDDTLCQNERNVDGGERDGLVPISRSGLHATCMTVKQKNMLRWLVQTTELIPVTARGLADFSDIQVDFGGSHRIVANGAIILDNGDRHDEEWAALMAEEMAPYQEQFGRIVEAAEKFCTSSGHEVQSRITSEHGMSISALFHAMDGNQSALTVIRDGVDNRGWHTHLNGNTLAFTPPPVSKRRAVEHMIKRLDGVHQRPVIGMGDSLSDLAFMSRCDFLSIPRGSQISSAFAHRGENTWTI